VSNDSRDDLARIHLLLDRSQAQRYDRPAEMVYAAELAQASAAHLDVERYGETTVADTRARVWAELANAYRVADALGLAEGAMNQAFGYFKAGSGDPELLALIADRLASLLCHLRRFPEALALLDHVFAFYRARGESHLAGRALVTKGLYMANSGDPDRGVLTTCDGLDLLDPQREPLLTLAAVHNLLWVATEMGRFDLVRRFLPAVRPLYDAQPNRLALLRLRWIEGRVAAGLGETPEGEALFQEARAGFDEAGLAFPASMVALDLALLWLGEGRLAEVKSLAEELIASFQRLRIGREAIVSLIMLRRACEMEGQAIEKIREAIAKTTAILQELGSRKP